jgi:uncharacterized CHY-type Zn-finger protein
VNDYAHEHLVYGIASAKAGEKEEACEYLQHALELDLSSDERNEAWFYLAEVSDDPKKKRDCLEECLAENPYDQRARRSLAILDGRLQPEEVVDPDRMSSPRGPAAAAQEKRMTCPKCGGRLTYSPDGSSLVCESCESRERLGGAKNSLGGLVPEQDFLVTMSTAKGHSNPVSTRTLACQACGATFVLPSHALSLTCPYCQSIYVLDQAETHDLIVPGALIPLSVNQRQAGTAAGPWGKDASPEKPAVPQGIYLPAWSFTITGQCAWRCEKLEDKKWIPISGLEVVSESGLLVAASPQLRSLFPETVSGYQVNGMVDFDPRYLADWPAETYQISVGDASLIARQAALEKTRKRIEQGLFERTRNLVVDSHDLVVDSYRLALLPAWIVTYKTQEGDVRVFVNGQTGEAHSQHPRPGWRGVLDRLADL